MLVICKSLPRLPDDVHRRYHKQEKFFWDQTKNPNRHWLAANMMGEAYLGFGAFNSKKITCADTLDFIKYRQNIAEQTWG